MNEISNDRSSVFAYLASTSGVQISSSAVINGFVDHGYVVVHRAAPRYVQEIVRKFVHVSLTTDGLLIPVKN